MTATLTRRGPGLYDRGDWTVVIGSDWKCDGSHRDYEIDIIHRVIVPGGGSGLKADGTRCDGLVYKTRTIKIPTLKFKTAFRLRRFGAFRILRVQDRFLRRLANI